MTPITSDGTRRVGESDAAALLDSPSSSRGCSTRAILTAPISPRTYNLHSLTSAQILRPSWTEEDTYRSVQQSVVVLPSAVHTRPLSDPRAIAVANAVHPVHLWTSVRLENVCGVAVVSVTCAGAAATARRVYRAQLDLGRH